ncbi:hypothetical protein VKT23_017677 [Stygiomarasmius scandens]|uniref:Uncharacterized protein n=1 Tax=Marasmiellus scandens TaxID=2682957 RepID=A0ABR1IRF7_9AGAR
MSPPNTTILTAPVTRLKECTPYLMPFHVEYTGKAPISMYLNVEEAKKNVGAPKVKEEGEVGIKDDTIGEGEKATDSEEKSVLSSGVEDSKNKPEDAVLHAIQGEIQPVTSTQSNIETPSASALAPEPTLESIISTSSATLPSTSSSLNTLLPSASTSSLPNANSSTLKPRFKSTFHGRTIQGLTVDLPPGYTMELGFGAGGIRFGVPAGEVGKGGVVQGIWDVKNGAENRQRCTASGRHRLTNIWHQSDTLLVGVSVADQI